MTPEWVKNAKVGDKVVCIRQTIRSSNTASPKILNLGKVYIITEIKQNDWFNGDVGFILRGMPNETFGCTCFKPLEEHKTGIFTFTSMLNKSHKEDLIDG